MDARHLVLLSLKEALQQRRTDPQCSLGPGDGDFEDALQDGIGLHNIKLSTVQVLGGRLEQPCLEQVYRGGHAKHDKELYPISPRAVVDDQSNTLASTVGEKSFLRQ